MSEHERALSQCINDFVRDCSFFLTKLNDVLSTERKLLSTETKLLSTATEFLSKPTEEELISNSEELISNSYKKDSMIAEIIQRFKTFITDLKDIFVIDVLYIESFTGKIRDLSKKFYELLGTLHPKYNDLLLQLETQFLNSIVSFFDFIYTEIIKFKDNQLELLKALFILARTVYNTTNKKLPELFIFIYKLSIRILHTTRIHEYIKTEIIQEIIDFLIKNCRHYTVVVVDISITLLNYIDRTFTGFNISKKIELLTKTTTEISDTYEVVKTFTEFDSDEKHLIDIIKLFKQTVATESSLIILLAGVSKKRCVLLSLINQIQCILYTIQNEPMPTDVDVYAFKLKICRYLFFIDEIFKSVILMFTQSFLPQKRKIIQPIIDKCYESSFSKRSKISINEVTTVVRMQTGILNSSPTSFLELIREMEDDNSKKESTARYHLNIDHLIQYIERSEQFELQYKDKNDRESTELYVVNDKGEIMNGYDRSKLEHDIQKLRRTWPIVTIVPCESFYTFPKDSLFYQPFPNISTKYFGEKTEDNEDIQPSINSFVPDTLQWVFSKGIDEKTLDTIVESYTFDVMKEDERDFHFGSLSHDNANLKDWCGSVRSNIHKKICERVNHLLDLFHECIKLNPLMLSPVPRTQLRSEVKPRESTTPPQIPLDDMALYINGKKKLFELVSNFICITRGNAKPYHASEQTIGRWALDTVRRNLSEDVKSFVPDVVRSAIRKYIPPRNDKSYLYYLTLSLESVIALNKSLGIDTRSFKVCYPEVFSLILKEPLFMRVDLSQQESMSELVEKLESDISALHEEMITRTTSRKGGKSRRRRKRKSKGGRRQTYKLHTFNLSNTNKQINSSYIRQYNQTYKIADKTTKTRKNKTNI